MSAPKYNGVYNLSQECLIQSEFNRKQDQCYLDHAGATLYAETQIASIVQDLTENLYGNPHSINSTSKLTNDAIDIVRLQCLKHFNTNAEEYSLIFTSGATAALKLVAECFDYGDTGCFAYLEDNHTSVLGMRSYASKVHVMLYDDAYAILNNENKKINSMKYEGEYAHNSLFVYPAQSNFCGTKYPLRWIENVRRGALNVIQPSKWYCLLDAAAFVSTNELDLSSHKPDFVCISFYKMFGYPTGLGALLVKNNSACVLKRKYYGGGTVLMTMSTENIVVPRNIIHSRFEDGTLPFLSILSLKHGFKILEKLKLNMDLISKHTFYLAQYTYRSLNCLHHSNGNPAVILYHNTTFDERSTQGGIVNFNLLRPNGEYVGYAEVSHIANLFGVQLRTGCFCNPGACQRYLKLTSKDVLHHFAQGHVCGDQHDLIDGVPTGSIRISFGYMSTKRDADDFLKMIEDCFVVQPTVRKYENLIKKDFNNLHGTKEEFSDQKKTLGNNAMKTYTQYFGILESIYLYPIKSCGFFRVTKSWNLGPSGLEYDREFMVTNDRGVCLTQKNNTELCKIKPSVDLKSKTLEISYNGEVPTKIPLIDYSNNKFEVYKCQSKVCGDAIEAWNCGKEISLWLSHNLKLENLKLLRQCSDSKQIRRKKRADESVQLSLTNEAQFLLINRSSVEWLWGKIDKANFTDTVDELIERFRPNFVVDFKEPFVENSVRELHIDNLVFKCIGNSTRCQMICINQTTGEKSVEPLRTLSKEFGGKITFGIYLKHDVTGRNEEIFLKSKVVAIC